MPCKGHEIVVVWHSTSATPLVSATAFKDCTGDDTLGVGDGGVVNLAISTDTM